MADVLAELLCIGRDCHSYDSDHFCHINTVLLIYIYNERKRLEQSLMPRKGSIPGTRVSLGIYCSENGAWHLLGKVS